MITDTCTWHTRLDTHAHTRYLYEHELGYSMEYAIGNTPSVHAAEPRRAPTCTESAPHLHRSCTSEVLAIAPVLHIFRTKSAPGVPTLKSTRYHIELSGFGQPKSTDTHGKYDLGTAETKAVLYTIDTEIHTKYIRIPPRWPRRRRRSTV